MSKITLFCSFLIVYLIGISEVTARHMGPGDYDDYGGYGGYGGYGNARNYAIEYEKKKFNEYGKGGQYERYRDDGPGGGRGGGRGYGKSNQFAIPQSRMGAARARALEYEKSNYAEGGKSGDYLHYKDDGRGGGGGRSPPFEPPRSGGPGRSGRARAIEYERRKYAEGGRGGMYEHYKDDN